MPERVESTLFVREPFRDANGYEWKAGDRASLAYAAVRRAASERPELFMVEFSTEPFDPLSDWFQEVNARHEQLYAEAKLRHDGAEERRQTELRDELREQQKGQPDLERRYREQEKAREARAKKAREAFERERIERELEYSLGPPGFHH